MKTRLLLALCTVLAFLNTSCHVNETITINEDGSGAMDIEMDASQLMGIAGEKFAEEGRVDSLFTFKDIFKDRADSIAKLPKEQQERFKVLEQLEGRMLIDPETGEFKIMFKNKFKNATELVNLMSGFDELSKMKQAESGKPAMDMGSTNPAISYFYDGKKFKKTVKPSPKAEEDSESEEVMEKLKEMFKESSYTVNLNFPKKVKSVSNKSAQISNDRKTVTVVYSFLDYMETPASMDLEVELE